MRFFVSHVQKRTIINKAEKITNLIIINIVSALVLIIVILGVVILRIILARIETGPVRIATLDSNLLVCLQLIENLIRKVCLQFLQNWTVTLNVLGRLVGDATDGNKRQFLQTPQSLASHQDVLIFQRFNPRQIQIFQQRAVAEKRNQQIGIASDVLQGQDLQAAEMFGNRDFTFAKATAAQVDLGKFLRTLKILEQILRFHVI
uniref:(northern house mosquito) hypothetical protein n=1 Tax=Culex pipiens TaxID=7175 RepID=A0A8D8JRF3_CULPI